MALKLYYERSGALKPPSSLKTSLPPPSPMNKATQLALLVALCATLAFGTTASAQEAADEAMDATYENEDVDVEDDDTDFGWIGLLGLAGLAGLLKRPERAVVSVHDAPRTNPPMR